MPASTRVQPGSSTLSSDDANESVWWMMPTPSANQSTNSYLFQSVKVWYGTRPTRLPGTMVPRARSTILASV